MTKAQDKRTNGGRGWDVRFVARSGRVIVREGYATRGLAEQAAAEIAAEYGLSAEIVAR